MICPNFSLSISFALYMSRHIWYRQPIRNKKIYIHDYRQLSQDNSDSLYIHDYRQLPLCKQTETILNKAATTQFERASNMHAVPILAYGWTMCLTRVWVETYITKMPCWPGRCSPLHCCAPPTPCCNPDTRVLPWLSCCTRHRYQWPLANQPCIYGMLGHCSPTACKWIDGRWDMGNEGQTNVH